jgi:hypothetical protein
LHPDLVIPSKEGGVQPPPWDDVAEKVIDEISKQDKAYSYLERRPIYVMRWNATNYVFALSKILEYIILVSWAFRPQVEWDMSELSVKVLNTLNTEADYRY